MIRYKKKIIDDFLQRSCDNGKFTIKDLDYGESDFGIEFKVKEIKNWLFGMWMYKDEKIKGCIHISVFGCDERDIDKFKPSRVAASKEYYYYTTSDGYQDDCSDLFEYIVKNKYLADYREIFCQDPAFSYTSKTKAFFKVLTHRFSEWRRKKANEYVNRKVLKATTKWLKETLPNNKIYTVDKGDCWSPRFDIAVVRNKIDELPEGNGCYGFDEILELHERLLNKYKRIFKFFGIRLYWLSVSHCFDVYEKKDWKRWKKYALSSNKYKEAYIVTEVK